MFKVFLQFLGFAVLAALGIDLIIYLAISINFASFNIANWSEKARLSFALIAGFKMLVSVGFVMYMSLMIGMNGVDWAKNEVNKNFKGYANLAQSTDIRLPPPATISDDFIVQEVIDAIQNAILANPILTINNGETYLIGSFAITRTCIHFENQIIACDDRLGSTASRAWKIAQNATSGTLGQSYLKTFKKEYE